MCPVFPSALPLPLLTLRLSSPSFLDTVLVDPSQSDETGNPIPLFTLETIDNHTTLYRCDSNTQYATNDAGLTRLASIQWPTSTASGSFAYSNPYASTPNLGKGGKGKASPIIFFGDEAGTPANAILKKSLLGGSKKFYVPGQSSPLKWKRVGSHYECTLCTHACTAHRAVALYEAPHTTSNGRLSVYTSDIASHQPFFGGREQLKGVDMEMLVYIIITSVLMVTPIDAWKKLSGQQVAYAHGQEQVHGVESKGLLNLRGPYTLCSPSPISPKANFKIDLLAPDEAFLPSTPQSHHSGLMGLNMSMSMRRSSTRRSTRSSRSSNTSSSIPSSPITPFTDLSHDLPGPSTFITTPVSSSFTPYSHGTHGYSHGSPSLLTSNISVSRRKSTKLPSPLITAICPDKDVSGPGAITPYYLPPTPVHAPPSPTHLSPTNTTSYPYTMSSSTSPTQRTPTQYNVHAHNTHSAHATYPMSTNALLLSDVQHTSEIIPTPRPIASQAPVPIISAEEMPPAYSEIEWTVRVKQPRPQPRVNA